MVGQTIRAKVIKLNRRRGNVVLSRRAMLEEEREEKKKHTLSVLSEGMVLTGTVKNLTDYGAFIDLGGIDGLLHVTDMSWGRVGHPSEIFQIGDQVEVVVLHFDRETGRVSLGYKQKSSDPWANVDDRYPVGGKVNGRIVSLTNYGAFVELEPGVEGLVHVSEMSWTRRVRHPSKLVNVGDTVEVMVLEVNKATKRISLGMKQVETDPWATITERYQPGMRVQGKVRNLTDFGAFVELEPGVDGLLHISDMSWTRNIGHPSELLKKGQPVDTQILNVDRENKRISLGLKQIQPDPVGQRGLAVPDGLARHRQGRAPHRLRRLRGAGARGGRPAAHLADVEPSHRHPRRHPQRGRRADPHGDPGGSQRAAHRPLAEGAGRGHRGARADRRRAGPGCTRGASVAAATTTTTRSRARVASRGRVALIALGAGAGVLVLFVFTVWLLLAVSDDGLPGGAKVAVVEVEGVIGVGADRGLDTESIIRTLGEYRDDPAVRAVVLRIDSPGGVVAPTQEIFTAVRRLREAKKPVVASLGSVAASGGYYVAVVRRPHLRQPRHAHRLDRRRHAARQRGGPAQEGRAWSTWWSRRAPTRTWATSRAP